MALKKKNKLDFAPLTNIILERDSLAKILVVARSPRSNVNAACACGRGIIVTVNALPIPESRVVDDFETEIMSRQFMEEDIVDGGGVGEPGGSTSSSDQVHYLHNGTVRRKLIVLKPESTFTSDPDRRSHLNHPHSDVIGNLSASDKRLIYSSSDHGSHLARMSFFDHRLLPRKRSWFSMKNCTRKLCLCFVVSIVSVIFGAAVGVYFGFRILDSESVKVKEFRGAFRVISGDNYTQDLMDTFSGAFLSRSQLYKAKLDTMFVSSVLKKAYLGSEILAIDPGELEESDDVIVRFNIRMDSTKIDVDAGDVYLVLINEILKGQSRLLSGIEVDEDSIEVHERKSKFIQDRESYELSTIPLRNSQLGKKVKLVTFTHNDEADENILSTTETIFPISHDDVSPVSKGNKVHQTQDDQISSPTKSTKTETALGYDFGSKLLEAILSGTNVSPVPEKSSENVELNDDSNAYNSPSEKSQLQEVTIVPHEFDGYVATLPKMSVSDRTETSESDKREVSVNSRLPSVQLPSVNVIVHQHDNFPDVKVKPETKGWFNEINFTTTTAPPTVSHPPRIVSITDLRGRTPSRTTEMTPALRSARPYLRRTTKSRYNGYEVPAETQKETRRTKPFTGRMRTSTQSPNLPQPSPVSSTSSPNDRYIEIRRNPARVSRRPSFGDKSRATTESRTMATTRSKLLRTAEFDNNVKSSTEENEKLSAHKNVIERQHSDLFLPPVPNSETIASTLLPFLPLLNPDRQCVPPELDLCANIDKNLTGIPSISSVLSTTGVNVVPAFDFIQSVLESGCFEYAHYFVCQLLQPGCDKGKPVLPCRYFCENFLEKCRYLLPPELYLSLSCNILPDKHEAKCVSKPECIHELRSKGQNYLVCDGIVDCHDMSDETRCSWCTPGQFLCGGRKCIDKSLRCDGKPDCPNEADERNCLALANNGPEAKHAHPYLDQGFVFLNDKGAMGKICADTLLKSISKDRREVVLKNVGESACELLNYKKLKSATTKYDVDEIGPYFHILNPLSWRVTFLEAPCKSKQVIHVSCSNFACGQRPSRTPEHMVRFLDSSKHAALVDHGDWPWHAALFSADIHVCDGTLVADQWILTSSACFQGVLSRQWSARIGIVRLESSAPFQQLRKVVGRMHSPVKGSDIVLVKLDRPVQLTDFVRPVCLPTLNNQFATGKRCVTLGWDLPKNQLRQVVVSITETEECLWRWPVGKLHVFCTAEPSGVLNDCQGEDQSGGPLLCEDNGTWFLTGVVNWRIGCGLAKQPRLYDSVSVNVNWIQTTIKNHQRTSMLDNDIVNM